MLVAAVRAGSCVGFAARAASAERPTAPTRPLPELHASRAASSPLGDGASKARARARPAATPRAVRRSSLPDGKRREALPRASSAPRSTRRAWPSSCATRAIATSPMRRALARARRSRGARAAGAGHARTASARVPALLRAQGRARSPARRRAPRSREARARPGSDRARCSTSTRTLARDRARARARRAPAPSSCSSSASRSASPSELGNVAVRRRARLLRDALRPLASATRRAPSTCGSPPRKLDGHVLLPGETFDFNDVVGAARRGQRLQGRARHRRGRAGRRHRRRHLPDLGHAARRRVLRRARDRRALPAHAAELVHQAGTRRDRRLPDDQLPAQEPVSVPGRAAPDGQERRRARRDPRPEAHAHRHADPPHRLDAIPYEEVERPDKTLPSRRARPRRSAASPGFKLRRYRIVRDGAHAVRERWDDVYPPTTQIVRVGTGEAVRRARQSAEDDRTPSTWPTSSSS